MRRLVSFYSLHFISFYVSSFFLVLPLVAVLFPRSFPSLAFAFARGAPATLPFPLELPSGSSSSFSRLPLFLLSISLKPSAPFLRISFDATPPPLLSFRALCHGNPSRQN
ncbi:hypothetical protein FB451DRAFT_1261943 [Mycena latifolia]|nr:hypothetical protein FB451DRAFT_1261943 [Mycena latifolia]